MEGGNGSDGVCEWRGRNKCDGRCDEVVKCGAQGRKSIGEREKTHTYN